MECWGVEKSLTSAASVEEMAQESIGMVMGRLQELIAETAEAHFSGPLGILGADAVFQGRVVAICSVEAQKRSTAVAVVEAMGRVSVVVT